MQTEAIVMMIYERLEFGTLGLMRQLPAKSDS